MVHTMLQYTLKSHPLTLAYIHTYTHTYMHTYFLIHTFDLPNTNTPSGSVARAGAGKEVDFAFVRSHIDGMTYGSEGG